MQNNLETKLRDIIEENFESLEGITVGELHRYLIGADGKTTTELVEKLHSDFFGMKTVSVQFMGRLVGSIGIVYMNFEIMEIPCPIDEDKIRMKLYEMGYEHISKLRWKEIEK